MVVELKSSYFESYLRIMVFYYLNTTKFSDLNSLNNGADICWPCLHLSLVPMSTFPFTIREIHRFHSYLILDSSFYTRRPYFFIFSTLFSTILSYNFTLHRILIPLHIYIRSLIIYLDIREEFEKSTFTVTHPFNIFKIKRALILPLLSR